MKRTRFVSAVCALLLIGAFSHPSSATEQKDIVVGLKALPLLTNKITGDAAMAVIYDPANAASKSDAEGIKKIVDGGVDVPGGGKLSATLVGVGELSKMSGYKIAFVTPGLSSHYGAIGSSSSGVLTITADVDCVKAAKCIVGVVTSPDVAIYYSKPAADAAKIDFSSAFAMLVKQL
jgi:hypothetical protein